MTDADPQVDASRGISYWPVSERNAQQVANWCGGQVDMATTPKGIFVPTLTGPEFAPYGSTVIRENATGRFLVEEDAQNVAQLMSNIDNQLQSSTEFVTDGLDFESEEDLQAHNQRKATETQGVAIDVRAMRLHSASISQNGMGHIEIKE